MSNTRIRREAALHWDALVAYCSVQLVASIEKADVCTEVMPLNVPTVTAPLGPAAVLLGLLDAAVADAPASHALSSATAGITTAAAARGNGLSFDAIVARTP